MIEIKYCTSCGSELIKKEIRGEETIPFCPQCNKLFFPHINLAILVILVNEKEEICLLKQKEVNDFHVLIAGYNDKGESLEETVIREVQEEVGINVQYLKYFKSYYYEKKNILMCAFVAHTNTAKLNIAFTEVDDALWVKKAEVVGMLRKDSIGYNFFADYKIQWYSTAL